MKHLAAGILILLVILLGAQLSSYRGAYHRARDELRQARKDLSYAHRAVDRNVGALKDLTSRFNRTSDWAWEFQARKNTAEQRARSLQRVSQLLLRDPAPRPAPAYAIGFGETGAALEFHGAAVQLPDGSLDLRRGHCRTRDFPPALARHLRDAGTFSLELAMPHNERFRPMLSLHDGPERVSLELVERNSHLHLLAGRDVRLAGLDADGPVHLVITVEPGRIACYANGVLAAEQEGVDIDRSGWTDAVQWTLGADPAGTQNWPGELDGIAVHAAALTAAEAHACWQQHLDRVIHPDVPGELRVLARLRSRHHGDEGLSLYGYQVVNVLAGTYRHPRLQVCHWTEIEGEPLRFRDALVGKTYALDLVELDRVPALANVARPDPPEPIPVYYDAGGVALTYRGVLSTLETEYRPDEIRPYLADAHATMRTDPSVGRTLHDLTGRRARVVWCRAVDGASSLPQLAPGDLLVRSRFKLIGVDTEEVAPRTILEGPTSCCNPTLTWDGQRIVYSDWPNRQVCVVNWDGTGHRVLYTAPRTVMNIGYARESSTGIEWVYLAECTGPPDQAGPVWRMDLARGEDSLELVWDQSSVSIWNAWSFSADGRYAAGAFPWPAMGVLDVHAGEVVHATAGCGMGLAPDDSLQYFHYLDGEHSRLGLFERDGTLRSRISLTTAPGMDRLPWTAADRGTQTWLPRWSNDKRFITVVGPVKSPSTFGLSNILVGRFAEDYSTIDAWVQISNDPVCEAMSSLWVEPDAAHSP